MVSSFDLAKLSLLLKDFYDLTHIRITVFDDSFHELAAYPEQVAPFCQIIRSDDNGKKECCLCDENACKIAAKRHSPYTYRCHAGLTESIAPLYLGNIVIGYLLFGHVFSYASYEEGWAQIEPLCRNYRIDLNKLKNACYQQPLISKDYIVSASHILQAVASFSCLERMVSLRQQDLPVQIDEYISGHFAEGLDAQTLCRQFHISRTQLYEISKQSYGVGIAEHIRTLRIDKAKRLLAESDLPLAEIAGQCGFKDYNNFITTFKRMVGMPPKRYAKNVSFPVSSP